MSWLVIFPDWLLYTFCGLMSLWALAILWLAWQAWQYTRGLHHILTRVIEKDAEEVERVQSTTK